MIRNFTECWRLIDYNDRIHQICESSEVEVRKQKLKEMASTEGINLEEQDIKDLVDALIS